jgi:Cu2+-exporting ATPase
MAIIDGKSVKVVSPGYLKENNLQASIATSTQAETEVYVLLEEQVVGVIALAD